jgi:hypothetical protein
VLSLVIGFLIGHSCGAREYVIMHDDLTPEVIPVLESTVLPESVVQPETVTPSVSETEIVASLILEHSSGCSEYDAYAIANEIFYQISVYNMSESDIPYLLALFYCESRFNPLAANPRSSARGVGQILLSVHGHKFENLDDWRNPADNIAVAFRIIAGAYDSGLEPTERWRRIYRAYSGGASHTYLNCVHKFS